MFLEWENNRGKLQIISVKFQNSGKFQNNAINDVKQISLSHVIRERKTKLNTLSRGLFSTLSNIKMEIFAKAVNDFWKAVNPWVRYFLFFHQMVAPQKLLKRLFISSKKLFPFSRYSNFCKFFASFSYIPDLKGQTKVE